MGPAPQRLQPNMTCSHLDWDGLIRKRTGLKPDKSFRSAHLHFHTGFSHFHRSPAWGRQAYTDEQMSVYRACSSVPSTLPYCAPNSDPPLSLTVMSPSATLKFASGSLDWQMQSPFLRGCSFNIHLPGDKNFEGGGIFQLSDWLAALTRLGRKSWTQRTLSLCVFSYLSDHNENACYLPLRKCHQFKQYSNGCCRGRYMYMYMQQSSWMRACKTTLWYTFANVVLNCQPHLCKCIASLL